MQEIKTGKYEEKNGPGWLYIISHLLIVGLYFLYLLATVGVFIYWILNFWNFSILGVSILMFVGALVFSYIYSKFTE